MPGTGVEAARLKRLVDILDPVHTAVDEPEASPLPWIETRPGLPYFMTERGESWTPVGQNDAVSWPELNGLFRRRDLAGVEEHLRWIKSQGVTVLRLMLEYAQGEHRYFEKPVGTFSPNMVRLWDDLFALCEKVGLYILLTPYDTFFMWQRWGRHPYNRKNGGPCASRKRWLNCPDMRHAIKNRLSFATDRWGGSPALFAWDIWNEMHPAHAGDDLAAFIPFIDDVGGWLRRYEQERHGRAHLQTVSIFGPELVKHPDLTEPIFRHPGLDFANTHLYEFPAIDKPKNTVAAALAVGRLMREAVREAHDLRPVFDSEHGPIHSFKDKKIILSEPFDDQYFRHMQWAHLASGGAGGGMRWPNRHPHVLTQGMRRAQSALSPFLSLIDWTRFRRHNLNEEIDVSSSKIAKFGCGDGEQAIVWLLRTDCTERDGILAPGEPLTANVSVPGLESGRYTITTFDTQRGETEEVLESRVSMDGRLRFDVSNLRADVAVAIRPK